MEKQLFTQPDGAGCDQADTLIFTFYDVTLVVKVGQFEKGDKFSVADIDYDKGRLTLWRGEDCWKFNLTLAVGMHIET